MGIKIIGFRGKKGVGKNFIATLTEALIIHSSGKWAVESGAFADPIKEFLCKNLGIKQEWCYGTDSEKNTKTKYDWSKMFPEIRYDNHKDSGSMTAREIMQVFGTDICRRCFGQDIWPEAMLGRINKFNGTYFLITDVRFENEVHLIHSWGGEVWQVDGPQRGIDGSVVDSHPSESQVDRDVDVDFVIDNSLGRPVCKIEEQIKSRLFRGE